MWKNLNTIQKGIFITLMCLVVPFAPEFILMSEIGGIELVFSFLVLYYKPVILKIQSCIERVKVEFSICNVAFKNCSLVQPKVYFTQALFYSCALVVTGSVIYSSVFFLPALMLNGTLV
jgi:hypothetical protein